METGENRLEIKSNNAKQTPNSYDYYGGINPWKKSLLNVWADEK